MANYVVRTSFIADDKMSAQMKQLRAQVEPLGRMAGRMGRKLQKSANLVPAILKSMVIARAVSSGISVLTGGVRGAVQEYIDLDQALVSTGAIFADTVRKGTMEFDKLQATARKVGATTEFTSVQAAEGLRILAMAGFSANQSMAALPGVVDLATASNIGFAEASDIATGALGAFNLRSEDSATLAANLAKVSDQYARAVTTSKLTMEDLAFTTKYAGTVFNQSGQSMETFISATGQLANSNIRGSQAGTTLRSMMLRLINPPKKAAAALRQMGVSSTNSRGEIRNFYDILEDLRGGMSKMTEEQRAATAEILFGKWAIAGSLVLLSKTAEEQKKYEEQIASSTGAMKTMADEVRKGLGKRLDILKSRLVEMGLSLVEVFDKKFPNAIENAIAFIDSIDLGEVIESIKKAISVVTSLGKTFYALRTPITAIMTLWGAMKVMLKVNAIVEFGTALLQTLAPALFGAAKAQGALNLAMYANPIGLVIMLVLLLAVAIGYVIVNWDELDASMKSAFESMKKGDGTISEFLRGAAFDLALWSEGEAKRWRELQASMLKAWFTFKRFMTGQGGNMELAIAQDLMVERATKTGRFEQEDHSMTAAIIAQQAKLRDFIADAALNLYWGVGDPTAQAAKSAPTKPPEEVSYQSPNFMRSVETGEFTPKFDMTVRNEFLGFPEGMAGAVKSTVVPVTTPKMQWSRLGKQ